MWANVFPAATGSGPFVYFAARRRSRSGRRTLRRRRPTPATGWSSGRTLYTDGLGGNSATRSKISRPLTSSDVLDDPGYNGTVPQGTRLVQVLPGDEVKGPNGGYVPSTSIRAEEWGKDMRITWTFTPTSGPTRQCVVRLPHAARARQRRRRGRRHHRLLPVHEGHAGQRLSAAGPDGSRLRRRLRRRGQVPGRRRQGRAQRLPGWRRPAAGRAGRARPGTARGDAAQRRTQGQAQRAPEALGAAEGHQARRDVHAGRERGRRADDHRRRPRRKLHLKSGKAGVTLGSARAGARRRARRFAEAQNRLVSSSAASNGRTAPSRRRSSSALTDRDGPGPPPCETPVRSADRIRSARIGPDAKPKGATCSATRRRRKSRRSTSSRAARSAWGR